MIWMLLTRAEVLMPNSVERQNARRAAENVEDANARQQVDVQLYRVNRENELPQQAAVRRRADVLRYRVARALNRENELPQQAAVRRRADVLRYRVARALNRENELPQQAAVRRRADVLRHRVRAPRLLNLARINNVLPPTHSAGEFTIVCEHCRAIKFNNENHFKCCHNGKVALPAILQFPAEIRELLSNDSAQAKQFRKYIRVYNNAFSFASLSANIRPPPGHGPPCFRICGQLFHRYGALLTAQNEVPNFSQLYIVEAAAALNMRIENPTHAHCNREAMQIIQDVLNRDSPYAAAYRNMAEVEREETARAAAENRQPSVVSMVMREGNDRRRYNAPLHQEVDAIFVGNDGAPPAARYIVVYPRNQPLRQIPHISCNIDPMMYPILFPRGDPGWDQNMAPVREHATGVRNRLTQLEYYIYRIAIRREFSARHLAGKLFQQFLVDTYVKVEGQRLAFIRRNQNHLRAESYQGLLDYLQNAADQRNLQTGNVVVLPSTFSGSPRNMHQLYLDAMALVSKKGKPDLFLTFTCNPKWPEVVTNLLPGQSASDRPDLVARVFKLKLFALKKDLKDSVLGVLCAHVDVIEFQNRGLPHVHMLLHLHNEFKLRNADDIDSLICARIPDQNQDAELYDIIKSCIIHGPCGHLNNTSPCMKEGECTKHFPKQSNEGTVINVDDYPMYHRPDNGRTVRIRNFDVDNRWVVPYIPFQF
ncbi:uncharacterized protein LOC130619401 [Hydractinia symbiolongicarpus]|uniref:uncharacterized protein LOC130619401 n=1 Tax=Hydractinia symbiolongicarpus TaxID=13093 RepID=UPI00254DE996|nr:uncharacterized protein LOC130619401 [Hydractinia symbiolongicarpus]